MVKKTVVITGASSGIGKASALHLDKSGFRVFAGVRKQEDAEKLSAQASPRLTPLFLDITDEDAIAAAADRVTAAVEDAGLAGLVNNAGIASAGPMEFVQLDDVRRVFEINLVGQIAVTRAFLALLRKAKGRVVNISSVSGMTAAPFMGPYSISKFALEAFSDTLRQELSPWGIDVIIIQPGRIETPIWDKSLSAAEKLFARLPQKAFDLYGPSMEITLNTILKGEHSGTPPDTVARTVARALTARWPKLRYRVGADAKAVAILVKLIPTRWLDKFVIHQRGFE
ncbi:MAG: SDR family oxidoreductase [Chloroflexota bacterium]|nr:SDR family oxidoreductase [Chloroflexota bacterium]